MKAKRTKDKSTQITSSPTTIENMQKVEVTACCCCGLTSCFKFRFFKKKNSKSEGQHNNGMGEMNEQKGATTNLSTIAVTP